MPGGPTNGQEVEVKLANSITGPTVMNINGTGNVSVVNPGHRHGKRPVANGIYTFVYDANGTRWQLQGYAATPATAFTTGDIKLTLKTTADAGWAMFNDGTIGDASSGAH